jgi:general nucleoside transport system ATP-binding protein
MRPPTSGRLVVAGREVTAQRPTSPAEMRRLGVAHVPEDRARLGMVGAFEAGETSILGYHRAAPCSGPWRLDREAVRADCAGLMERFDVRPPRPRLRSSSFSGGNQQKLVLAREIAREPRLLLVGQPTRGVDIGAVAFIHRQLVAMREAGCAVLIVSAELEEVMALADRIVVMFAGRVVGEVAGDAADEPSLGRMMANLAAPPEQAFADAGADA